MKRSTLYAVSLAGCVAALICTFIFAKALQYDTTTKSFQIGGISYNSADKAKRFYQYHENTRSYLKSFDLSMRLLATSMNHYDNAFQTAPLNNGLRLELSKPNNLALITGAHNAAAYNAYVITRNFSLKRWHTFDLKVDKQNHITVHYDGALNVNKTDPDLAYELSDIAIGTGMSETRPFSGQIKDAAFSYRFFERKNPGGGIITVLLVLFFVGAAVFLFLLTGLGRPKGTIDVGAGNTQDSDGITQKDQVAEQSSKVSEPSLGPPEERRGSSGAEDADLFRR